MVISFQTRIMALHCNCHGSTTLHFYKIYKLLGHGHPPALTSYTQVRKSRCLEYLSLVLLLLTRRWTVGITYHTHNLDIICGRR